MVEKIVYTPQGVCSKSMEFEIEDNKIVSLKIIGGCPGNLLGISQIVKGMDIDTVIERFDQVRCGGKPTSCPDQIAKALKENFKN